MAWLYFVRGQRTRLVKIGQSKSICFRLDSLQTGSPDILELLGVVYCKTVIEVYYAEKNAHEYLKEYHSHGEWFSIPKDILENTYKQESFQRLQTAESHLVQSIWGSYIGQCKLCKRFASKCDKR